MSEFPLSCTARKRGKAAVRYEVNGTLMTVKEAADMCGVSVVSFRKRMERHGETVAGAVEHYKKGRPAKKTTLSEKEREAVDKLADMLMATEPDGEETEEEALPVDDVKEETETPYADMKQCADFDRQTLMVLNDAIGALKKMLELEMFDMEIDRKANELVYDLDLKRFELFGALVDWNEIAGR